MSSIAPRVSRSQRVVARAPRDSSIRLDQFHRAVDGTRSGAAVGSVQLQRCPGGEAVQFGHGGLTGRSVRVPDDVEESEFRADRTGRGLQHLLGEAISRLTGGVLDIGGGDRRTLWIGFEDVVGVERDGSNRICRKSRSFGMTNTFGWSIVVMMFGAHEVKFVEDDRAVRKVKARRCRWSLRSRCRRSR